MLGCLFYAHLSFSANIVYKILLICYFSLNNANNNYRTKTQKLRHNFVHFTRHLGDWSSSVIKKHMFKLPVKISTAVISLAIWRVTLRWPCGGCCWIVGGISWRSGFTSLILKRFRCKNKSQKSSLLFI